MACIGVSGVGGGFGGSLGEVDKQATLVSTVSSVFVTLCRVVVE